MLDLLDFVVLGAMMFFGTLSGLFIAFKVALPRLRKSLRGEAMNIGNQVTKGLAEMAETAMEGVDLGGLAGGGEGIAGLAGVAESFGIDLGPLKGIAGMLGGKKQEGGGSSGW